MNKSDCVDRDTKYTRKCVKSKVKKSSRRTNLDKPYLKHKRVWRENVSSGENSYQTDSRFAAKIITTGDDTCDSMGKGSKRKHSDNYVEDGPVCSKRRKEPEPEAVAMSVVATTPVVVNVPVARQTTPVVVEIPVGVARPMISGLPVSHAPRSINFNVRVNTFPNRVARETDPPIARVESMYVVKVVVNPLGANAPGVLPVGAGGVRSSRNPDADDEMSS